MRRILPKQPFPLRHILRTGCNNWPARLSARVFIHL
jgi:hypothetical protein